MVGSWDIFLSYRRHDLPRVQPLLAALAEAELRVWWDKKDIPDHEAITEEIRRGLANSKALIAFYSRTYPESRACQEELITAWLAAQRSGSSPNRRVWLLNPEGGLEHIPEFLRDQQVPQIPQSPDWPAIARKLKSRVETLGASVLGSGHDKGPRVYGTSLVQAPRFTGRVAEMWELHVKLTADRISIITGVSGQPAVYLCGLAGNGKSLLAREYAIRFGPAFPGGIFWLRAFGHDDAKGSTDAREREAARNDQLRGFALEMGLPIDGLKPIEIEVAFWSMLERRSQRCLWIVDDLPAGEPETSWHAKWSGASTLATTRSQEYRAAGTSLRLGVLSSADAFAILCSHRNPITGQEKEAARETMDLLGYHPLAVEIAGSYLARGLETFESYRNELLNPRKDALELGALLSERLPTGHERSISGTLLKSIRQLGPEGLDFLRLASVVAVAPIQLSFMVKAFEALNPDGEPKPRAIQGDDEALMLSLCEPAGKDARTVHTLVSRTIRFAFPDAEEIDTLRTVAMLVLGTRLKAFNESTPPFETAQDLPHARHLTANESLTIPAAYLAGHVARYDLERANYFQARKLQERVVTAFRQQLGEEHRDTLAGMNNLVDILWKLSDLAEARKLQEHSLSSLRRLLGEEHLDTLWAVNNLARVLRSQGDLAQARKLQESVLNSRRRLQGEEHVDTLTGMSDLAETLLAQGDLVEARKLQEHALLGLQNILGEEHPVALTALNDLALTLQTQGELEEARKLQEQGLAAARWVLGEEHPDTLTAMNNLALNMHLQGDFAGARELQEHAMNICLRRLEEKHPVVLMAVNNLAATLYAQGDLREARKLQEQNLSDYRSALGEEHRYTLKAMNNLAETLCAQGELVEARKFAEQVLKVRLRLLGEDNPDTLQAMTNLVGTLYVLGSLAEARELGEQVLKVRLRLLGEDHPDTLRAMTTLAVILYAQHEVRPARKLAERALFRLGQVLGADHPDAITAKANYAQMMTIGSLAGRLLVESFNIVRLSLQAGKKKKP